MLISTNNNWCIITEKCVSDLLLILQDTNYGSGPSGLRRSVTSELTPHAPKPIQDDIGHADGG